ncbi:MAG: hypothetical protein A3J97_11765 [Spirochaetes bacterium RIFOXYC1_FULL_54_7]|nr:MAG: hypothetical protein A3J97_11765 [Spirochaetes bacterium RIFOXYC1_FULL_54_7]
MATCPARRFQSASEGIEGELIPVKASRRTGSAPAQFKIIIQALDYTAIETIIWRQAWWKPCFTSRDIPHEPVSPTLVTRTSTVITGQGQRNRTRGNI